MRIVLNLAAVGCFVLLLAEAANPECECNCPCTRVRRPVCAVNNRSTREFANKCLWKNYNCKHRSGKDAYPEIIEGPCRGR